MARYKGLASFSANIEPQIAAPLDARSVVDIFDDLLEVVTWTANDDLVYAYKGMVVSVVNDPEVENNGLYMLMEEDFSLEDSWEKIGSSSSGDDTPFSGETVYSNLNETPIEVGGIKIGEIFSGDTMSEVFDRLFYPTLYPEIVEPTVTFSFVNPSDMYQELGDTGVTFTVRTTVTLGSINPPYGTFGDRIFGIDRVYYGGFNRGLVYDSVLDDYVGFNGTVTTNNLVDDRTVSHLTQSLNATTHMTSQVRTTGGEQPKDSKGDDYLSPFTGTITTVTLTVYAVHPYFATTSTITDLTKQKLEPHNKEFWEVSLVGETDTDKQIVQLPTAFGNNIDGIQFFNTISNNWEWLNGSKEKSQTSFTKEVIVRNQHGTDVNYNEFTHIGSKVGARKLRFVRKT